MKKFMFTLALSALVTMGVQAQKQMGDEHNIEVAFTPFGDDPINGSTIKYRNFLDDNRALRFSFAMSRSNDLHAYVQAGEITESVDTDFINPQLDVETKSSAFTLAPGYEWHFDGMDNLSPYFAVELPITIGNKSQSQGLWYADEVDDLSPNPQTGQIEYDQWVPFSVTNEQGWRTIALNVLFGADYYFSDGIYLGFEAGLGFNSTKWGNHVISTDKESAFNLYYEYSTGLPDQDVVGQELMGEFVGQLPFDVLSEIAGEDGAAFYHEYWDNGGSGETDQHTAPNHISNTTFGNVFQGGLRIGFLFD
jgi:hypothetical protein